MIQHMLTGISAPWGAGFKAIRERQKVGGGTSHKISAARSVGIGNAHLLLQTRPGQLDPQLLDALELGRIRYSEA
jgi:hypothetical protein